MQSEKQDNWFQRLKYKYLLSVVNEDTLTERWHVRISWLGVVVTAISLFLLTLALLSLLIVCTPIRTVLPGYSEDIRQRLVQEVERVDSLDNSMLLQRQYLGVVQQVLAGEIESDTIHSLDSMQLIKRAELLEAKNEATAEFIEQYENREKDNLQLFDIQSSEPTLSMFRPVHGVVTEAFDRQADRIAITIQTPKSENVTAVLAGAVVMVQEMDDAWTVVLQHVSYVSIYRGIGRMMRHVGDYLQAGETIGIVSEEEPFRFELWQNGRVIDPQSVIAF